MKLNDKWQPVGHLPGAILVQTGELLAGWTTDLLPALVSASRVMSNHAMSQLRLGFKGFHQNEKYEYFA